jgi:hypothetical protein
MSWGTQQQTKKQEATATVGFGKDYYRDLFNNNRAQSVPVRCALVAKENCAKTGLGVSLIRQVSPKGSIYVFDVDNSAQSTIEAAYPDDEEIVVLPLLDERDDSIYQDDGVSVDYANLIEKVQHFVSIVAEKSGDEEIAGIIFDGGSTFLKWCEQAMTASLLRRGVIKEEGDGFNQKEWRERNRLFRDTLTRLHGLPVPAVVFTFHMKDVSEYVDNGSGGKVMMKVGEKPEWEKGTMRLFSQQIFLSRYMKKADSAAGIKADPTLKDGDWVVKATIEEMKGRHMEHLGETHTILKVSGNKVEWTGLPMLTWG